MKKIWSSKWKKCLIWFSAYMSFIAFTLVGGYTIVKDESEDMKKTAKTALIVSLIFACVSGFLTVFYNFGYMSDSFYGSAAYDFYDIFTRIVNVAKVVVFAVFIIMGLAKKEEEPEQKKVDAPSADTDTTDNQQ